MSFSKMIELLQTKNKDKIVFCNAGNFYIAIGKDAVLLNKILELKLSCFKNEVCKVGFPIGALEKYTEILASNIVYYFDQNKEDLEVILEYKGKNKNNIIEEKYNCYLCSHGTSRYKRTDKYLEAVAKLYENEIKDNEGKK